MLPVWIGFGATPVYTCHKWKIENPRMRLRDSFPVTSSFFLHKCASFGIFSQILKAIAVLPLCFMLQLRCFRRKFIWCCWSAACSLHKEALGLERPQCEPLPWKSSWWPPHTTEANTQRGIWHQGAAWSSGNSVHCSRAAQKGNGTHRAQAGPQEGRC